MTLGDLYDSLKELHDAEADAQTAREIVLYSLDSNRGEMKRQARDEAEAHVRVLRSRQLDL